MVLSDHAKGREGGGQADLKGRGSFAPSPIKVLISRLYFSSTYYTLLLSSQNHKHCPEQSGIFTVGRVMHANLSSWDHKQCPNYRRVCVSSNL